MIRVTFSNIGFDGSISLDEEDAMSLQVEGHSMAGTKGNDIICSAVSALSQTAIIGISKVAGIEQSVVQKDGFLKTEFRTEGFPEIKKERLRVILDLFCIGVLEIIREYPETVKIDFVNTRK